MIHILGSNAVQFQAHWIVNSCLHSVCFFHISDNHYQIKEGCRIFSKLFFQVFVCVFLMYFDNCSFLHVWSFSVYVGCSEFNCQGARASLQLGIQFLWFHCSMTCIVCTMLCVDVYHSYNPLTDHCIIILTHRQCQTFSWCCGLNLSSHTQSVS